MCPFLRWVAGATLAATLPIPLYGAQDNPLTVAVSIPPQKFLLDRIGGDRIRVHVMLEPGQAPETFEPTPRQMAALADAQIYFRIGVPFERAWLSSTQEVSPNLVVVDCCSEFTREITDNGRSNADPHVWVSPVAALNIADLMRQELIRLDPQGRQDYESNFRGLSKALKQLDRDIGDLLKNRRTPYFLISHDSLGPFAAAYGLVQLSIEAGGKAAGPRAIAEIVMRARMEKIGTVFVQRQFNSPGIRALAEELDAEMVEIDPLAEDYISNMSEIAAKLALATR